jgi:hypothetical protein
MSDEYKLIEVVEPKPIIIVRSKEQLARAIVEAGPDFAKIHKGHFRDPFIRRK